MNSVTSADYEMPQSKRPQPSALATLWEAVILPANQRRRRQSIAATFALVLIIGLLDFFVGFELSLLVFYILPVCLAVAAVGWQFGAITAVACVASWLIGDFAAGAKFSSPAVPVWNAVFALSTYLIVIWMFRSVLSSQRELEERVRQRTDALVQVIQERERLEKAILEISDRERRNIGQDLHDDLGQHLTGTAFACSVLCDKLRTKLIAEEADAQRVVDLLEEGIDKTRRLARGLLLAEIKRDGLVSALGELAAERAEQFGITCELLCETPSLVFSANEITTHLFRITQEAVNNGILHGKAPRLVIRLCMNNAFELSIRDFGVGLPSTRRSGLGLSIMAHRAEIIGAELKISAHPEGGTIVICSLPLKYLSHG